MQIDLTQGSITKTMLRFAVPMICGNLLQQLYNIVDTLIVGQYLGADALAAVGSAYTLMTFLTSIFLGLCMGSGAIFAIRYGEKNMDKLKDMFTVKENNMPKTNSCNAKNFGELIYKKKIDSDFSKEMNRSIIENIKCFIDEK